MHPNHGGLLRHPGASQGNCLPSHVDTPVAVVPVWKQPDRAAECIRGLVVAA
ncbi:hypothetical protein ACFWIB_42685 [Streptomyces sp. NPDC127051]|uniref:hypothetical protein n=1 Tax=Streptomyces sp. NPDC127051 TaxID=3347119 RepID=UPI0036462C14